MVAETSLQLRKKCKMPTGSCHDYDQEDMRRSGRTSGCTSIDGASLLDNYLSWRTVRLAGKARNEFDFGARLNFCMLKQWKSKRSQCGNFSFLYMNQGVDSLNEHCRGAGVKLFQCM